jgi:hypothetical protein
MLQDKTARVQSEEERQGTALRQEERQTDGVVRSGALRAQHG